MVVNHVQHHAQAMLMGHIDKAAKIVGLAIQSGGGEQIDPVVAPAKSAVEFCHRHHFQQGHAQLRQLRNLGDRRVPRAGRRESADVHFIDDSALQTHALPLAVLPLIHAGIDYHRGPMRTIRLQSRRGIGVKLLRSIQ